MFEKTCPECKGEGKFGNAAGTDWIDCEECSGEGIIKNKNILTIGVAGKGKAFRIINETK